LQKDQSKQTGGAADLDFPPVGFDVGPQDSGKLLNKGDQKQDTSGFHSRVYAHMPCLPPCRPVRRHSFARQPILYTSIHPKVQTVKKFVSHT